MDKTINRTFNFIDKHPLLTAVAGVASFAAGIALRRNKIALISFGLVGAGLSLAVALASLSSEKPGEEDTRTTSEGGGASTTTTNGSHNNIWGKDVETAQENANIVEKETNIVEEEANKIIENASCNSKGKENLCNYLVKYVNDQLKTPIDIDNKLREELDNLINTLDGKYLIKKDNQGNDKAKSYTIGLKSPRKKVGMNSLKR